MERGRVAGDMIRDYNGTNKIHGTNDVFDFDTRIRSRKKSRGNALDARWLLPVSLEAGTHYIPQFDDEVMYFRQGHQEYIESSQSEEKGPWFTGELSIGAAELCRIIELKYDVVSETRQTCCNITLEFIDREAKVFGKCFQLTLPELTNSREFIIEKSLYDSAMRKVWAVEDKCQVFLGSDVQGDAGQWWDGEVVKIQAKCGEFPHSPWKSHTVKYELESHSNKIEIHSPWKLFQPGHHLQDAPHIDDESKYNLLFAIHNLEMPSYVGVEDDFGLKRLRRDCKHPLYLNKIPLPLDLETVKQRLDQDYYHSLMAFRHDIELLVLNTESYYGMKSEMTAKMNRFSTILLVESI